MKYKFWILLILVGGILMIVGSAIGSGAFYTYLIGLAIPYIGADFIPLVSAILIILEYITVFGGYSVLVGLFLMLIKYNKVGHIIITVATSFGVLGLVIYTITWIVGYFGVPLNPTWQTVLDTIYNLFTFNSGTAFAGTAIALFGNFGLKRAEKADVKDFKAAKKAASNSPGSKLCPNCGSNLPKKANFCNNCGKSF